MGCHPEVIELVERCLAAMEQRGGASVDAILAEHPEHSAAVRKRLQALAAADLLDEEDSEALPEVLGDFRLLTVLGRGGMGVVYRALQISLGREVALKMIRPEHMFFPDARARFRREVESVARLEHPGIVPVYVVGEAQGVPFFAMELVDGVTLEQVVADLLPRAAQVLTGDDLRACVARRLGGECSGPLFSGSWVTACCQIAAQVVDALDHAHQRGVLHRDVKPSNIMITKSGRVRLLDFGLARVDGTHQLTRAGAHMGSLPYMAPEQLLGAPRPVDVRTDVYAVGVLLYEMLALRPAFWSESAEETRRLILAGECVPLRQHRAGVPWDAETVCSTAMDADPERRYPTVDALGQDLHRLLAHRPILAQRPAAWLRARRWSQRHPVGATVAILGAALVVGSVLYAVDMRSARDRLARSHTEEKAQRERAETNLEGAIAAIDGILEQGSDAPFGEAPVGDPARQRLLEQALHLYEELLEREGGHAGLALRVVKARWRVGRLRLDLGMAAKAEEALRPAVLQSAELCTAHADPQAARLLHLDISLDLIRALIARGAGDEATRRASTLAESIEAAPASAPGLGHGQQLVDAWQLLAKARQQTGAVPEAITAAQRAVAAGERLVAATPEDAVALASLARALQSLAYWTGFHRLGDSAEWFERALTLLTRAIERSGNSAAGRADLARIHSAWAHVNTRHEQWAEAIGRVGQAQAVLVQLMTEHPGRVPFAEAWLANQCQLGWLLRKTGDTERADAELQSGIALGEPMASRHPDHHGLAYRLATLQTEVARSRTPADGAVADALWEAAHRTWLVVRRASPNPTYDQHFGAFFDYWARFSYQCGRSQRALELTAEACAFHRAAMAQLPDLDLHRVRLVQTLVLSAVIHGSRGQLDAAMAALAEAHGEGHARATDLDTPELRRLLGARADYRALLARARSGGK